MIKIQRGASNTVALTLYEKTTIAADDAHYLFEFINAQSNQKRYFIGIDTSNFISRYNLFTIVETEDPAPDPLAGEVTLEQAGQWHYFVYEQESDSNLDPTGLTLVESGFVQVTETAVADSVYQSTPIEYQVYVPGS